MGEGSFHDISHKEIRLMKHWHYSRPSRRPVNHSHKGGNRIHTHLNKGWLGYGRTKKSLMGKEKHL